MIVRQTELKTLEKYYGEAGNQLILLYGREGAGTRQLLKKFTEDKKLFYYHCAETSPREQQYLFGKRVEEAYGVRLQNYTYEEYFNRVRSGDASKLVLVIDEFQYIVKKDPEFLKHVLKLKQKKYYPGPVMILLVSSSLVYIHNELKELPIKMEDKFTAEIKLQDLT